jgi:hypothetical protein
MKFLNFSNIKYNPIEDYEKILCSKRERENKQINNIIENNKIRKISIDSNNIGSDIFDKKYLIEQDEFTLDYQEEKKKNNENNIKNKLNINEKVKKKKKKNLNEKKKKKKTKKMEKKKKEKKKIKKKKKKRTKRKKRKRTKRKKRKTINNNNSSFFK